MRVILDTNLFISALLSDSATPPSQLVDAWRDKDFHLIANRRSKRSGASAASGKSVNE